MLFPISFSSIVLVLSLSYTNSAPLHLDDELHKLHFGGRWWRDGDTMRHSWGVGTFIVRFQGSSSLVVKMGAALGGAYYTCQVDGGEEVRKLVSNTYQEADAHGMSFAGLSSVEEHIIRCGRNNEASYGDSIITGVVLDSGGRLLETADPNADNSMIRFEAIGDSITAGYKVTVPPGVIVDATIENQNVFKTYVRLLADAWGTTDYQVIAKSGISILDYGTTGVIIPEEWPCREYWGAWEGECPELWDFSTWQADVVAINLGTNDFAFGNPTQQQFRVGYRSFIQQVREKYPNALIACIEPIQHSCNGESYPLLNGIVNGLEQAVNDIYDPKVIYYETGRTSDPWLDCTLSTQDFMDFTHPTVQGNQKLASRLLEEITEDVRRFFPEKCGGAGPTCGPGVPATPVTSPVECTAIRQSQLSEGRWETTDANCNKCQEGYVWWPCDLQQPLCEGDCGFLSPPLPAPVSPSIPSPVSLPTPSPMLPSPNPIPSPTQNPENPVVSPRSGDSRMIAYLGNWQACPSDEQIDQYTHIVIAFAVSYAWAPNKNQCSTSCEIAQPSVCDNQNQPELIKRWRTKGKKVILSFGGAGMGGSWSGDNNDCWDYCFGREDQVIDRLTELVTEMNLDGVDIDYEYFYDDNQNGSGFARGAEAKTFLRDVTLGLRDSLPSDSEITHAPMGTDVVPGKGYFDVLKEVAGSLDFLMPQYYNGYVRSYSNFEGALTHYTVLTNELFGGDPTKIVYGFCIGDCNTFNLSGDQSAEIMGWLSNVYPCNGGAYLWVANDDKDGVWSSRVNEQLEIDATSCSAPTPISSPVSQPPTFSPVSPTQSPVSPTASPMSTGPGETICSAIPQSELPSGAWATTYAQCQKCEDGYQWWPCDTAPSLCDCVTSGNRRRDRAMLRSVGQP